MRPPVLVVHAPGTNRDREAAWACERAGGAPSIVPLRRLLSGQVHLADFRMLVIPGGFSFGDDLGAGRILAARLAAWAPLHRFVESRRPVLGICNGFQVLVKAGLLPGDEDGMPTNRQAVTLTHNASARFECRWVVLEADPASPCIWTTGAEPIHCPVAHGEGRIAVDGPETLARIADGHLAALRYAGPRVNGAVAYPHNPNGSVGDIAGLTNAAGNVLGLMPHPEDHLEPTQHPGAGRRAPGGTGAILFENGVRYAKELG